MDNPKEQLVGKLKDANNVLVTVSANPSVDQLAAAIGLTLFLSKMRKHSTAVFSGQVPSTIEFLKPEETIEGNTDSLQDFIIALDKNKADKIRYKVEDQMVKIFITPYRTSIGEGDLVFSKGDFNVDVVVALGVKKKDELDQAITAHGRILHDATVAAVNIREGAELGSLNWTDTQASSLCEMVVQLTDQLKPNSFDSQIATALLTGIVAETERFSNDKTDSQTMSASAKLMAAGANQQLVASKLEEAPPPVTPTEAEGQSKAADEQSNEHGTVNEDGSLVIHHEEKTQQPPAQPAAKTPEPPAPKKPPEQPLAAKPETTPAKKPEEPPAAEQPKQPEESPKDRPKEVSDMFDELEAERSKTPPPQIHIDNQGQLKPKSAKHPDIHVTPEHREFLNSPPSSQGDGSTSEGQGQSVLSKPPTGSNLASPPSMGGNFSAATDDEEKDSPLNLPPVEQSILSHESDKDQKNKGQSKGNSPPNLTQAAEPRPVPPPVPTTQPAPTPPKEPNVSAKVPDTSQPNSKLPESFLKVLDDETLKELEQRTHSPHRTRPATGFGDKTLQNIEKTVESPHITQRPQPPATTTAASDGKTLQSIEKSVSSPHLAQKPQPPAQASRGTASADKPKEASALDYEAHESEPPPKAVAKPAESKNEFDKVLNKLKSTSAKKAATKPVKASEPAPTSSSTLPAAGQKSADSANKLEEAKQALEPKTKKEPTPSESTNKSDTESARAAVTQAINAGGDGRTSPPPLKSVGAQNVDLDLGHDNKPEQTEQAPGKSSPNIHIDEEGRVTFNGQNANGSPKIHEPPKPKDPTASNSAGPTSPPPLPPPMAPPPGS